jgi:hypothetical protein
MYSTTAYLYQQIQTVLLVDISGDYFTYRWNPVYSKPLTINKGVDNVLLFEFVNQDQKPVNVSGSEFIFRLLNQTGDAVLLTKEVTLLSPVTGRARVVISALDTDPILAQPASYSLVQKQPLGNYQQAVYVDANSQARAQCNVVDSALPEFVPSQFVTIPTIYGPDLYPQPNQGYGRPDWALPQNPPNPVVPPLEYSSQVSAPESDFHTFQLKMDHYTGNVKVQSATQYQGPWFDVSDSYDFYDESVTHHINVPGFYPLLRLAINNVGGVPNSQRATASATCINGEVTEITVTSGGYGYLAPPQVSIVGAGAGATAEATINNGIVTSITVTNGGSGYSPVPPENVGANVYITTGEITEVLYR